MHGTMSLKIKPRFHYKPAFHNNGFAMLCAVKSWLRFAWIFFKALCMLCDNKDSTFPSEHRLSLKLFTLKHELK
jgi:hypothetical protein